MTLTQIYSWFCMRMALTGATTVPSGEGLAEDIFDLFNLVADWLVSAFGRFVGIFWNATTGLTFLGVLATIALAIGIAFLIMGVIQRFLHFRS